MDLTVMICTWNNCQRLGRTLDAIAQCAVPRGVSWEVVVVNNNCSDDTDAVTSSFSARLPLVCIREPHQGVSRARNAGLSAASGNLIIFTDDDVKPRQRWISAYWEAYQEKPWGCYFGGPIESDFESSNPDEELLRVAPASVRGLDWGPNARTLAANELLIGPNWACPAEILKTLGGFDTRFGLDPSCGKVRGGEETELMKRLRELGWSSWYVPDARISHFVPARKCTLKHVAERAEAYGFYTALVNSAKPHVKLTAYGVPRWMYRKALRLWFEWILKRIKRDKAYEEYVSLRYHVGLMAGSREAPHSSETLGIKK